MLVDNTPIDVYHVHGVPIFVKREDLCCPYPGPSFSKMRGVVAHIQNRPEEVIGCLDTFHSKAGWAVAWACKQLGKQAVDFWPRYVKDDPDNLAPRRQQQEASHLGALLVEMKAGRSSVLYHQAKKMLAGYTEKGRWGGAASYIMPNALKLPESITENAAEAKRTAKFLPFKATIVLSVSSGTVAAGVLLGLHQAVVLQNYDIILHMGYDRSEEALIRYMEKVSGLDLRRRYKPRIINQLYEYKDPATNLVAPFPCNPYYDLKAWKWLGQQVQKGLIPRRPIVFWNIGD